MVRFKLVLLSLVSVTLYGLLSLRSEAESGTRLLAQYFRPRMFEATVEFWGIWVALFALYVIAVRIAARRSEASFFAIIFTSSILFRAAVLLGSGFDQSEPTVFLYGTSPLSAALAHLELGFVAERSLAILADLAALALAPSLLKSARLPVGAALIHGWNPLVIKEVAGSGRVEVVAFLALLLTLFLIQKSSFWGAAVVSGASFTGPLMLIASLPLLVKTVRARMVLGVGLALAAWNAAFVETTWMVRAGWPPQDNIGGSITPALAALANLFVTRDVMLPLSTTFGAWTLLLCIRAARLPNEAGLPREALFALGSLVLISPQVLPWAFIAFAYLAVYSTNRGWVAFTATAPMIYLALEGGDWNFWLGFAQYFVPYALLIFYWLGRPPHEAAGA